MVRMVCHRLPQRKLPLRIISGKLEDVGQRARGGKDKYWADCVANGIECSRSGLIEELPHQNSGHGMV